MATLAEELSRGLIKTSLSKGGKPLFFDENIYARSFADLFSVPQTDSERSNFYEAFRIVTQGQGDELRKINSLTSSALLCLLTFYPLFNNTDRNTYIDINGERYYRCFFEVRNRVIRNPSCVDVVLISTDDKKMLFLESKLSEYADGIELKHTYGKGYKALYEDFGLYEQALSGYLKLGGRKDKLVLQSVNNKEKIYIEGIKQSISHLIGLTRGPQYTSQGYYPEGYYQEYKKYYDGAEVLLYGTILFDPAEFHVNTSEFQAYSELYRNTIINHGDKILECIVKWNDGNTVKDKKIEILNNILTYQDIFSNNHNRILLNKKVSDFYKL